MAIRRFYKIQSGMVWWKSGNIYTFSYNRWKNDPEPTVLCLYALVGKHPKTGHVWNFMQAINLNYVPRSQRKQFVKTWLVVLKRTKGNVMLTWEIVKRQFPFMVLAFRRYLLYRGEITNLKRIPLENIEKVVVQSWIKDYSKQALIQYVKRYNVANNRLQLSDINSLRKMFGGEI